MSDQGEELVSRWGSGWGSVVASCKLVPLFYWMQCLPVTKLVGVEMSGQAVEDARVNAKLNGQPLALGYQLQYVTIVTISV